MPPFSEARVWSRVQKVPGGCWLWTGSIDRYGYGRGYATHLRTDKAHRLVYILIKGEIPPGLQLDHLCRVRHCVNPDHLEPVTARTNSLRGNTIPARRVEQTHCIHGHPFDEINTYIVRGNRTCRACNRLAVSRYTRRRSTTAADS